MSLKFIRTPLSLVLAGCLVTAFSARADIVIGVAGPFTGPNATYGDQYWHGATQAAEDINAAGGPAPGVTAMRGSSLLPPVQPTR